jgi:hypothetical protein
MGRCADCKHWDREGARYAYNDEHWSGRGAHYTEPEDATSNDREATPHRICTLVRLVSFARHDSDIPPADVPFTRDASGYIAELWTPPTWTCPKFEPRASDATVPPVPD